jgi:hypothetical protein
MTTKTTDSLSDTEQAQLAREIAADQYDREWPLRTTLGNVAREAFMSGWDAAMEHVEKQRGKT